MNDNLTICGTVVTQPEVHEVHTRFILKTEEHRYGIIRSEPMWQKRDVLFIRVGQTVNVTGKMDNSLENTVLAKRIQIIGHPELVEKEEIEYDTETVRQTASCNSEI